MPNSTNWCFTLNLAEDADIPHEDQCTLIIDHSHEKVKYVTYQLERGGNSNRLHYQGFVQTTTMSFKDFKRLFTSNSVHVEAAKAKELAKAREYCRKEDTRVLGPWEWGSFRERAEPGKRSDLDLVVTKIKAGTPISDIAADHGATYVRNYRGLAAYTELIAPPPKRQNVAPNVWVYEGVTGSGKSRRARDRVGERVYLKSSEEWWCGYDPRSHDYVLFEEFEGPEWMPPSVLLQVVDRYSTTVRMRGRESMQLSCINFVFTCNLEIKQWYSKTKFAKMWYDEDWTGTASANCKYMAFMRRLQEGNGEHVVLTKHWDDQTDEEKAIL